MLTAQDIQSQQFHVRFRGFDVEEVDDFLERVAESVLALSEENKRLRERVDSLEKDLATFQNQQKTFQNAILSAQHIAEEMQEKSRQEAAALRDKAKAEADDLLESARQEIANLEHEVDRLEGLKAKTGEELRQLLGSCLEQIDRDFSAAVAPANPRAFSAPPDSFRAAEPEEAEPADELYEKIELADDFLAESLPPLGAAEAEDDDVAAMPVADLLRMEMEDDAEESTLPDLDGDMVFTLEDPLDRPEPAIKIDHDDSDK